MEPKMVYRPVVADSHHFEEEQVKSWIRIRIEVKSWIRIRIKAKSWTRIRISNKVMRIRNPA